MVKRIILIALFLLAAGAAVWQNLYVCAATEELVQSLKLIETALIKDEPETAARAADDFCAGWDKHKSTFEALFEHKEVDTISATAKSIQSLCASGEKEEALAHIAAELFYINHIKDIDSFGWENVF